VPRCNVLGVQRVAWTDERLDDLFRRMDAGLERIDRDLRELRSEVRGDIGGLRTEMRSEIDALRGTMNRLGTGLILAMFGLAVAQTFG
jgi:HPt (histidine-containing phosphotransfer) domain-containing protein